MAQSRVKRGSVVLIRYPFTDLTGAKVRPALVLTPDHLLPRLEDVLCLFISSVMPEDLLPTDFVLELNQSTRDWHTQAATFARSSAAIFSTAVVTAGSS